MSLESLRSMRRVGRRPADALVLIGRAPAWLDDAPGVVTIARRGADLSPLVGLPVHVMDLQHDESLTRWALDAMADLGVQQLGVCGPAGACGASPEHEQAMQRHWRHLCGKF